MTLWPITQIPPPKEDIADFSESCELPEEAHKEINWTQMVCLHKQEQRTAIPAPGAGIPLSFLFL